MSRLVKRPMNNDIARKMGLGEYPKSHLRNMLLLIVLMPLFMSCGRSWRDDQAVVDRLRLLEGQVLSDHQKDTALSEIQHYASSKDALTRGNAIAVLGGLAAANPELSNAVLPMLTAALSDKEASVRKVAAARLADLAPDLVGTAVPQLVERLGKETEDTTAYILEALSLTKQKARPAIPYIISLLSFAPPPGTEDEAPQLRIDAANALGAIGSPTANDAIPQLNRSLNASNPYFQIAAAKALLVLRPGDDDAKQVLSRLGSSPDVAVRKEANAR